MTDISQLPSITYPVYKVWLRCASNARHQNARHITMLTTVSGLIS